MRITGQSDPLRIDADLLIPGKGDPVEDGTLISCGDKIEWVGHSSELPREWSHLKAIKVPVLMPGLWDCHTHYIGAVAMKSDLFVLTPQALAGARLAKDIANVLNAGFTSVREMAGYGAELQKAINEGWLAGPRIYSSVSPISITAGHGDAHSLPANLVNEHFHAGGTFYVADGIPECIKAVRLQIRRGAEIIKICATGGVLSLIDSPHAPEFSVDEIRAMTDEAARADMIVGAHCHGTRGILNAINGGCKTIEHGSYLTDEAIKLMLEKDVMLVATRFIVAWGVDKPEYMDPVSYKKMLEVANDHKASYRKAVAAGVKIALGTDIGISGTESGLNHGRNGKEFYYAVEAGMTPLQAIEAGTASAPATLGSVRAPKSGQLKKGYDSDFIAVAESPLKDILVLSKPDQVTHVWKGGKLYKSPGHPVSFMS